MLFWVPYLSRGQVVLHADDVQVVIANGRYEAASPGSIAQQGGGVGAVRDHMVVESEDLDEAQAEEAVVAAHDHVHERGHHQHQGAHLSMLARVYGLQHRHTCSPGSAAMLGCTCWSHCQVYLASISCYAQDVQYTHCS